MTQKEVTNVSSRAGQLSPSLTFAIDSKVKKMKSEGIEVLNLGLGEPDADTPEHIKAATMGALDAGFTKYTAAAGIPELRAAISEKLKKDNSLSYDASQIVVTCGAKQACYNALLAVVEPGEEVMIPSPYWVSYPEMVKLVGGVPIAVPTSAEEGYKLTPELFREYMSPLTKMVILNSPNNPTGTVYTENELAALAEVAMEEGIMILSDEIYEKLTYDGAKHVSTASFSKEIYNNTITVNGFSKPYAMTGWRLGYVAAPAPIAKAIENIQGHSTSNATSFAQQGALAAYKAPQDCVEEMLNEYAQRRTKVMEALDGMRKVSYVKPMGAFYILLNISRTGMKSTQFCEKFLNEEKVALVPGIAFGDDDTVRLSYAASMECLEQALSRLSRFCS